MPKKKIKKQEAPNKIDNVLKLDSFIKQSNLDELLKEAKAITNFLSKMVELQKGGIDQTTEQKTNDLFNDAGIMRITDDELKVLLFSYNLPNDADTIARMQRIIANDPQYFTNEKIGHILADVSNWTSKHEAKDIKLLTFKFMWNWLKENK